MNSSDLFSIKIIFDKSHLFFPEIIHWALFSMLAIILATQTMPYWKAVQNGEKKLPFTGQPFDSFRFFGTLFLTIIYFLLMPEVGSTFPNTGYGFWFVSIPYMFFISLLYVHKRDKKHLTTLSLNALIAPSIAWYVLSQVFAITLP